MAHAAGVPWRWRLAGTLSARLPQWPGRARVVRVVRGHARPEVTKDVRFGPDLTFTADLREDASTWFFQYAPPSLSPVIDTVLRPGGTFVDVGANIGTYACWAARRVGPGGRVVAFEPVPATREALAANVRRNGLADVVTIRPEAVGATTGTAAIFSRPGAHGLSSFAQFEGAEPQDVAVVSLDRAVEGPIDLVKVDVEGFEAQVVSGLLEVLERPSPPVLVIEVIEEHLSHLGATPEDVLGPLRARGYRCYSLTPRGLVPREPEPTGWLSANVLALKPGAHDAVLERLRGLRFSRDQFD